MRGVYPMVYGSAPLLPGRGSYSSSGLLGADALRLDQAPAYGRQGAALCQTPALLPCLAHHYATETSLQLQ